MSKFFSRTNTLRQPQRHSDPSHNAYGKAHKGIVVCKDCKDINFKKQWKHPEQFTELPKNLEVHYATCPACAMAHNNLFEGEIAIQNVPENLEHELTNLISAYAERANQRDSQHRVLRMIKQGQKTFRVLTSENQLAVKLAKKIKAVFRGCTEMHISHSMEPFEVDRVRLAFV